MLRILLRMWVLITLGWWIYNLWLNRDKLATLRDRDWGQALEYGINNIFCDLKLAKLCRDVSVSFFQRGQVNETFGLIVTFVGWPFLLLIVCLLLAWALKRPAGYRV